MKRVYTPEKPKAVVKVLEWASHNNDFAVANTTGGGQVISNVIAYTKLESAALREKARWDRLPNLPLHEVRIFKRPADIPYPRN